MVIQVKPLNSNPVIILCPDTILDSAKRPGREVKTYAPGALFPGQQVRDQGDWAGSSEGATRGGVLYHTTPSYMIRYYTVLDYAMRYYSLVCYIMLECTTS